MVGDLNVQLVVRSHRPPLDLHLSTAPVDLHLSTPLATEGGTRDHRLLKASHKPGNAASEHRQTPTVETRGGEDTMKLEEEDLDEEATGDAVLMQMSNALTPLILSSRALCLGLT